MGPNSRSYGFWGLVLSDASCPKELPDRSKEARSPCFVHFDANGLTGASRSFQLAIQLIAKSYMQTLGSCVSCVESLNLCLSKRVLGFYTAAHSSAMA